MNQGKVIIITIAAALTWTAAGCRGGLMKERSLISDNAPEFPVYDAGRWINSPPLTMKALRGKTVVVDFWEYTCVNCIRTLPYVKEWNARYAPYDVVIIGVHTPEFEFGKEPANVARAARDFGLTYPIVLDNDYEIWRRFANSYWPRKYIVAPDGKIVYDHIGEGGYAETEQEIQDLVKALHPDAALPKIMEPARPEDGPGAYCLPRTPELYAGSGRGRYGNAKPSGTGGSFQDESAHTEGLLYLDGSWNLGDERVRSKAAGGYLAVPFSGNEINAVMRAPEGETVRVDLRKDGRPLGKEEAGEDVITAAGESYTDVGPGRMYRLYKSATYGAGELRLTAAGAGVEVYAFTFGSCRAP